MASSSHAIPLPFDDLIADLKHRRFKIGVEQHLRLFRLLEKLEGQCEPKDLRTLLCPIFASSRDEQIEFYRIFDSRYALFFAARPRRDQEVELQRQKARSSRRIRFFLPLITCFVLTATFLVGQIYRANQHSQKAQKPLRGSTPVPTMSTTPEVFQQPRINDFGRIASSSPAPSRTPPQHANHSFRESLAKYRKALHWGAVLIPCLGFLSWETFRRWRRSLVLERARGVEPAFTWLLDVPTQPLSDYNSTRFAVTARKMRRRQIGDVNRFDIALTVASTMEGLGYPVLCFRPDTRFPEYLLLIERASSRDHQAALFTELSRALERESVFIDRFFFENDPRLCWSDSRSDRFSLAELRKKFPEHKLLIFSEAERFLDTVSGKLAAWATSLCEWRERAVLTAVAPAHWGFAERKIAMQFIVLPATIEGINRLANCFDTALPPDIGTIIPPVQTDGQQTSSAVGIEELRGYLGEPVFRWLCACAVYPELRWELTVYLGSLSVVGENIVTEHNLLRLVQLPWFRAGSIPDPMRLNLIESLGSVKETAVRDAVVELFKRCPAPYRSGYSYRQSRLAFLTQSALRYRSQRKRLKAALRDLSPGEIAGDYVLLRSVEKAPASKLLLLLPRSLRKIIVEDGRPLFGLTTATRALVTIAAIGILWWSVTKFAGSRPSARSLPTPAAQMSPAATARVSPTATAQVSPTATAQVSPTATAQVSPTPAAQASPTATAQVSPTATAQVSPTPAVQPSRSPTARTKTLPQSLNKLEIFTWWTSGNEAAAVDALFGAYKAAQPGVEIINATVAGGGGSAARPVLQVRLAGGNPPDTWQTHPGSELLVQYVEPGYCAPVDSIYQSEGWNKVVPRGLIALQSTGGKTYSVVVGVHRGNILWYNKKLLEKVGITIGDKLTFQEFFAACDKLKAAGIPALGVGDSGIWASAQLFENTLLGVVGPQGWIDLFGGKMQWDNPKVKQAMTYFAKMQDYLNPDHSALSWDQAVGALIEGKVAFTSMGDWSYGEFAKAGQKPNVDFGWVCHPGTDGSFILVADGFTLAKGAPHKEATLAWLKSIGSKNAQEAFSLLKGSIPARTDCDRSKFNLYYQWSMQSFARDALLPSCVHGEAAPAAFQQALNDAVTAFVVDKNVDNFANALVQAAKESGTGK